MFIGLVASLCIPGFRLSQLSCSGACRLVERSPRTWSFAGLNPTRGSLKKEKTVLAVYVSCPASAMFISVQVIVLSCNLQTSLDRFSESFSSVSLTPMEDKSLIAYQGTEHISKVCDHDVL